MLNDTPTAVITAPSDQAGRRRPRCGQHESQGDHAERGGAEGERRQPIGDACEGDAADHDHAAVHEQHEARVHDAHADGVQRREGEEPAHRHERGEEPERDRQGGAVDEMTVAVVGWRVLPRLADEQGQAGGRHGECCGAGPREPEAGHPDERLAERRPEGDAEVETQRVVRERLAETCGRRKVGEGGE